MIKTFLKIIGLLGGVLLASTTLFAAGINANIGAQQYMTKTGVNIVPIVNTYEFGSTTRRWAKGWFTDLDVSGIFTFGGVMASNLDMDGYNIIMDTDADSALVNDRDATILDDQIGWRLNNVLEGIFTATDIRPATDDAWALGVTNTNEISDLFLNTGAVIGFENNDLALTHSSNTLTMSGGNLVLTQPVNDGAQLPALTITGGAHTAITAATEASGIDLNFSAVKTWAAGVGPLATQREVVIQAPTYNGNAGGVLTITQAATVAITGAPIDAGANITLSNFWALWVQSGGLNWDHTLTGDTGLITGWDVDFATTGAGAVARTGVDMTLNAGSTTSSLTSVLSFDNLVAGISTAYQTDGVYGSRPLGNRGIGGYSRASTAGHNIGGLFLATLGNVNWGVWAASTVDVAAAANIGIIGIATNDGAGGEGIGVYALYDDPAAQPNITANIKTALLVDNAANAVDIAIFRDNTAAVFTIQDGGNILMANTTITGVGSAITGTAGTALTFSIPNTANGAGVNLSLRAASAGGAGDNAGGDIILQPGLDTGNGAPGSVDFYTVAGALALSWSDYSVNDSLFGADAGDITYFGIFAGPPTLDFAIIRTASSVNYLQAAGAIANSEPSISALGTDADINITLTPKGTGVVDASASSIRVRRSVANITVPPTDAELDTAFGDPTVVGAGFIGVVDDNDAGTNVYWVYTTGTAGEWFYIAGTKAL